MKKFLTLAAIFALVFTTCEEPTNKNNVSDKLPSLTIRNESSFDLTDVKFSGISFSAVSGSNDLPKSTQSVKELKKEDLNKPGYITFIRKDIGIACRTEAITIGDEDYTFTFLNDRQVEEIANNNNRNSLAQISFISKVTVELGGLSVPKNDIVEIEEFVGFTKQTEFTLKNTGVGKLLLTGTQPVKITGTGADAFSVVQPTSSEIAPNNSLTFKISFSPGVIQDYNATVTINSNDRDGDFTFTMRARGTPPKPIATVLYENGEIAQNGTINAGEVIITLSKSITVFIKNTGAEVLTLDTANITITGADAEAFIKTTNPGGSISIGGQTSFVIECKPTKQGENNAILTIPTNDNSRNPVVVYLKVTGVKGSAVLELKQGNTVIGNNSLTPFSFGRVEIGTVKNLSFMIINTGNITLNLSETSLITSTNTAFEILSQPVTKTLIPGASVSFTVRFTPTAEADAAAFIDIPNDSDEGLFTLNVTGTGYVKRPQITIAYGNTAIAQNGTIDAGEVLLTLSKNITVTIKNTGEEVLTVDTANITITGANAAAFSKITNPGGSISIGGESSFVIKCEPVVQGENNAVLTIPSNDINRNPVVVYLKFTGVKGSGILSLSQGSTPIGNNSITPFDFGQTALDSSKSLVFTITNSGNIPLVLTGTPAVVSSNAVFTVTTQPANTTINPSAAVPFIVQYTPTAEQTDTGTITITNDSNDTLFVLNVKATGYTRKPQITVFHGDNEVPQYGTINLGDVLLTQSQDITVIIKNTGEELLTVNTANVTVTGATVFTKTTNPAANVSVGGQTQFVIRCTPTAEREYQATLTIPTNDSFRTPYIVYLQANAVPVIYQIGDTGPAGGIIFYDAGSTINGWRYLEASLTDFNTQWGAYATSIGNTGLSIGDGKQNTQLIVAKLNQLGETGRAAQVCANLNLNGFTDWFLPSRDELDLMYQQRNTIGGFSNNYYWSSSEDTYTQAWTRYLGSGSSSSISSRKDNTRSVRAIRRF